MNYLKLTSDDLEEMMKDCEWALKPEFIKQLLRDQDKAELFDNLVAILRKELPKEELDRLSVLIDPESRKILAYLVATEKGA